jgi:hypothetical protein
VTVLTSIVGSIALVAARPGVDGNELRRFKAELICQCRPVD